MTAHLLNQSVSIEDDEWGTNCHKHPERPAVRRVCVEADSFGLSIQICARNAQINIRLIKNKNEMMNLNGSNAQDARRWCLNSHFIATLMKVVMGQSIADVLIVFLSFGSDGTKKTLTIITTTKELI